jgi:CRISPR-associated endonuclease Cas1
MFDGLARSAFNDWSQRNEHWISKAKEGGRPRRRRERRKEPLILCGHGVSLRVDGGTLLVRNGLTHYPQQREELRFFKGDPAIPPRIIMLDGSGSISFDVLDWLAEQHVSLIRIDWRGNVVSVLTGTGFAADPAKVRWQIEARADPDRRIRLASGIISEKIANSLETLEAVIPPSASREQALARHHRELAGLKTYTPSTLGGLLGIEGQAASEYFKAWEGLPLRWTGTSRKPIPEGWRLIGTRSSVRISKAENVGATHPLNAILNYAYAVLQSQLHIKAVGEGYDPTIGIMHNGRRGELALVFDLMEPYRPKVDAAVLKFAFNETFSPADFVLRSDGVVKLAPQLARRVGQLIGLVPQAQGMLLPRK